ncbi:hypothetical protein, partial [uncultured Rothia sp.]|uniref:hypothetical protein n=1 Tax=uncultured Rothia sp. TaxID=316088 RepID=UPI0025DD21C5
ATHTTIQTPKHPRNPKRGEVEHKTGVERVSDTLPGTKNPSQRRVSLPKLLQKKFKNLQKSSESL